MSMPSLSRAQSAYLNLVRGLAAMAVLVGHAGILFMEGSDLNKVNIQSAAVLTFFLLSGFLISYSTFRKYDKADYSFSHYFIDRFCRIYCAFLPALVFVWLVDMHSVRLPLLISGERLQTLSWVRDMYENMTIPTWIGNLLMLQDFPAFQITRHLFGFDSHWFFDEYGSASPFWTISIEWWLYMAFGVIVLKIIRDKAKITPLFLLTLGFLLIVPFYYSVGGPDNCLTFLWLMGMTACLLFLRLSRLYPLETWRWAFLLAFFVSVICMGARLLAQKLDGHSMQATELQFSVFLACAVFSLLFFLHKVEKVPVVIEKICNFIAGYSYSLYLTHATVIIYIYLRYPGNDSNPKVFWIAILVSNVVAIVFWWLFERHYHALATKMKKILKDRQTA